MELPHFFNGLEADATQFVMKLHWWKVQILIGTFVDGKWGSSCSTRISCGTTVTLNNRNTCHDIFECIETMSEVSLFALLYFLHSVIAFLTTAT